MSTLHRHVSIYCERIFVFCASTQVGHTLFMEIFIYKKGPGSLYEACSRLFILPQTPHFYMVKLGVIRDIYIIVCAFSLKHMSRVVRKPVFYIRENKDADQLHGNREADQRLCFHYIDSTIPLLSKSKISIL